VQNEGLRDVVLGLQVASIIESQLSDEDVKELFWLLHQVEGKIINIFKLPDGRFYVYDEYRLRKKALENGLDINLIVTRSGLEHLIKKDVIGETEGIFWKLASQEVDSDRTELALNLSSPILIGDQEQKFIYFDPQNKIYRASVLAGQVFELERLVPDAVYLATFKRPNALYKELMVELENYRIFNHYAPIVIIDNSDGDFLAQDKERIKEIKNQFSEAEIIHSASGKKVDIPETTLLVQRYGTALADYYQQKLESNSLDPEVEQLLKREGILRRGTINTHALITYLEDNMFEHISGVRNHTILLALGKGDKIIMNIDDDAPPETYMVRSEERNRINKDRLTEEEKLVQQLIKEAKKLDPQITDLNTLYKYWDDNNPEFKKLEQKYFGYDPTDSNKGLIPQAMGEIKKLTDYELAEAQKIGLADNQKTAMRYQPLMSVPELGVNYADFVYTQQRYERKDSPKEFIILPVDTFTQMAILGKKVSETDLLPAENDLRGVMGEIGDYQKYQEKRIIYIAFPFVGDQDTSAIAQGLKYTYRDASEDFGGPHLQHTHRFALLASGLRGFAGGDYIIFNRGLFDISVPFPTIGRELRLEEPPYVAWIIAPAMNWEVTSAYATVGGGQIREIEERLYKIGIQDFTEVVGAVAQKFYQKAIRIYENKLTPDLTGKGFNKAMQRLRLLGQSFLEIADALDELCRKLERRNVSFDNFSEIIEDGRLQLSDLARELAEILISDTKVRIDFLKTQRETRKELCKELEGKKAVLERELQNLLQGGSTTLNKSENQLRREIEAIKETIENWKNEFRLGESEKDFILAVLGKARDSIRSDAGTLILWPDVVEISKRITEDIWRSLLK
jgi:hypothetical protein